MHLLENRALFFEEENEGGEVHFRPIPKLREGEQHEERQTTSL